MANDWRRVYLSALGARPTTANLRFLAKWQPWEGGATNNSASFNYFNTTQRMPGSTSINSVGVQAYHSLAEGAQAFAKTLLGNSHYAGLVTALRSGSGSGPGAIAALATWVSGKPDSADGVAYAKKVLASAGQLIPSASGKYTPQAVPAIPGQPAVPQPPDLTGSAVGTLAHVAAHTFSPQESLAALTQSVASQLPAGGTTLPAGQPTTLPVKPRSTKGKTVVALAETYIGTPYLWGGKNPKGFDCSGLLQYVWGQKGVKIGPDTYTQFGQGRVIARGRLQPGDAVFFEPSSRGPGHVAMYIGNGKVIAAPHTGDVVHIQSLAMLAKALGYVGARRYG